MYKYRILYMYIYIISMCKYTYNGYMCIYLYMYARVHGSNVFCRSARYRFLQYQCTLGVVCLVQGSVESLCPGYLLVTGQLACPW